MTLRCNSKNDVFQSLHDLDIRCLKSNSRTHRFTPLALPHDQVHLTSAAPRTWRQPPRSFLWIHEHLTR